MPNYLGIDNGLDGGLVWLNAGGTILRRETMPTREDNGTRFIDERAFAEFILWDREVRVCAERAAKFSKGKLALCSTWYSWGVMQAVLRLGDIAYIGIDAQKWQRAILPPFIAGDSKVAALETANKIWPNQNWLKSSRHRVPHDGLIDAALIAEYARRTQL